VYILDLFTNCHVFVYVFLYNLSSVYIYFCTNLNEETLFFSAEIRARDWCNVVTCHMDTPQAYVWRLQNFVIGEHILTPSSGTETPIKVMLVFVVCIYETLIVE